MTTLHLFFCASSCREIIEVMNSDLKQRVWHKLQTVVCYDHKNAAAYSSSKQLHMHASCIWISK